MSKEKDKRGSAEVQEALRQRVVHYLTNGKGSQQSAADIFLLSLSAVKKIWKRYQAEGYASVEAQQRGPRQSTARLSNKQVEKITTCVRQGSPEQYGLPNTLWTAGAVRELIKKRPQSAIRSAM